MIKFISVKCPECGASFDIEEGRNQAFCSYCGTKILIANENEHIFRYIDEADLKEAEVDMAEAETDRMVKMHQMEMENKESRRRTPIIVLWILAMTVTGILGIIGVNTDNDGLTICLVAAEFIALFGVVELFDKKKKHNYVANANEVVITNELKSYWDENYNNIVMLYQSAGFQNVTAIPLNDLGFFTKSRNGKVERVTINGIGDFDEGDVFAKSSHVLITYHSKE